MTLVHQENRDGVLAITFNDPFKRNPIGPGMREELIGVLQQAAEDPSVRALTFRGAEGCFSAGGDLGSMPPASTEASDERMARMELLIRLVAECHKPTTAGVERAAAGMSVGLAAACDYVVMGADAHMVLPFTRLGLVPDGGLMCSLSARVGQARAKRLLLLGDLVGAGDAYAYGLTDEVAQAGQVYERAWEAAMTLSRRAPLAVAAVKETFAGGRVDFNAAFDAEREGQRRLFFSADFTEGKQAFLERGEPSFSGS